MFLDNLFTYYIICRHKHRNWILGPDQVQQIFKKEKIKLDSGKVGYFWISWIRPKPALLNPGKAEPMVFIFTVHMLYALWSSQVIHIYQGILIHNLMNNTS